MISKNGPQKWSREMVPKKGLRRWSLKKLSLKMVPQNGLQQLSPKMVMIMRSHDYVFKNHKKSWAVPSLEVGARVFFWVHEWHSCMVDFGVSYGGAETTAPPYDTAWCTLVCHPGGRDHCPPVWHCSDDHMITWSKIRWSHDHDPWASYIHVYTSYLQIYIIIYDRTM